MHRCSARTALLAVPVAVYVLMAALGPRAYGDLQFLEAGASVLVGHGVHLYALRPDIQVGPLGLVCVAALRAVLPGQVHGALLAVSAGLLIATLAALRAALRPRATPFLVGASMVALLWAAVLPQWAHLDDELALTLTVLAWSAALRRHPGMVALALTGAIAAKPWAAACLPILLLLPCLRLRALLGVAAGTAATYLPFVVGDPRTAAALARFAIPAQADSLPALLGLAQAPGWERPVQLLAAWLLGAACLRAGRKDLLLLAVLAPRVLLDAGTFDYYTVELGIGLVAAELRGSSSGWRCLCPGTVLAWFTLNFDPFLLGPERPVTRLLLVVVAAGVASIHWADRRIETAAANADDRTGRPVLVGAD